MNRFLTRLAPVLVSALALAPCLSAQLSQRDTLAPAPELPPSFGIDLPEAASAYQALDSSFGRLVATSGDRIMIGGDSSVFVFNTATGGFEYPEGIGGLASPNFLDLQFYNTPNNLFASLDQVLIDGERLWIAVQQDSFGTQLRSVVTEFEFQDGSWVPVGGANGLVTSTTNGSIVFASHDGGIVVALESDGFTSLSVRGDGFTSPQTANVTDFVAPLPDQEFLAMDVSEGLNGELIIGLIRNTTATSTSASVFSLDGGTLTEETGFGTSVAENVTSVATDAGRAWFGVTNPTSFTGGLVLGYADDGTGTWSFDSQQGGALVDEEFGRALAARDGVLAIGSLETEFVTNADRLGKVSLARYAPGIPAALSGEVYHVADNNFNSSGDDRAYGAALALGEAGLVTGAPATQSLFYAGHVSVQKVYTDSVVNMNQSSGGIDSLGTAPQGAIRGMPFDGAPTRIEVSDGPSSSMGLLFFGFDLALVPFKTGILYTNPLITLMLPTDASGELLIPAFWDGSTPGPYVIYMQYWVMGPGGWSGTPGFRVSQPD